MSCSVILVASFQQWGSATISGGSNFVYFNYPVTFATRAMSAVLTHMNNNHVVYHSSIYLDSRSRCALFGESTFKTDTQFYIIAIGV
ncbi:gp53-like domain-containing protein [Megasphaera elsdenii]|uniref:gp53-like domain-containing protein n=1 Tax=Megasphaera elsdenii TaxID=907 RepID=UPI003D06DA91